MENMEKKQRTGRQKIEIKKIDRKNYLQVTFSKRRSGLFKKASELCILCGAEVVVIVFSPGNKPFVFGHPSVNSVIDRFLVGNSSSNTNTNTNTCLHVGDKVHELNQQYLEALGNLEAEKQRGEAMEETRRAGESGFWWDVPIEDLGLHELQQYKASLEELKKKVAVRANEMMMMMGRASTSDFLTANSTAIADPFGSRTIECNDSIVPHGFGFDNWLF